jgi:pyruvate dehydrogenase E2 component (dihydrolipoamide acetyltransferase)
MVTRIVMPRLSLTMKEGTVVEWFKKEGDTVQKGEPLVEVLSEKVTYDVEAPESGILRKILAEEGTNVPVDQVVGVIAAPDETVAEADLAQAAAPSVEEEQIAGSRAEVKVETEGERVLASPAAKRLARELNVDLSEVTGTGPEGRIVEEDVKRFAEQSAVKLKVREVIPLVGIRKTTAERLSFSARTAPHSTVMMEVDMSNAVKIHEATGASYTDILVKAVASALDEHRMLNSTLEGEQIKILEDVNVGVAVATERGLVVPVVHNADRRTLKEIGEKVRDLIDKAKRGELTKEDLTGGTFTVTNLGMFEVDVFIPIINPPEAAILGVGRIVEKPAVVAGEIKTKPTMQLSLAYDHRIVDGAPAAQFLQRVKTVLEKDLRL